MAGITRRDALSSVVAALAASTLPGAPSLAASLDEHGLQFGSAEPFSFEALKVRARLLAAQPWKDPTSPHADVLQKIDYSAFHQINFRKTSAVWADAASGPPVELFHLGRYFLQPVSIRIVEGGKRARDRLSARLFRHAGEACRASPPRWHWLRRLPRNGGRPDLGLARLPRRILFPLARRCETVRNVLPRARDRHRLAERRGVPTLLDLLAATGCGHRARVIIYAMLESPSVVGAYRFDCSYANGVTMDVDMEVVARRPIERVGIAPLTSMYWYSETDKTKGLDWRPEIHDSDGLALWTGAGERIWRPLNAPPNVMTNSFFDENPKGFGLLQRDRTFDHYEDDGVFYDKRPSVWIEPLNDWGRGAVQLVEIPTVDEIHDNIVSLLGARGTARARRTPPRSAIASTGTTTSPIRQRPRASLRPISGSAAFPARKAGGRRTSGSS